MIPAITQTLAKVLANGTVSITPDQISFRLPKPHPREGVGVNLYCFGIQESNAPTVHSQSDVLSHETINAIPLKWFDALFLVSVSDFTGLGEQGLLAEMMTLLLQYHFLPETSLVAPLKGYGQLPMRVSTGELMEHILLWHALQIPLRPALYITVTFPMPLPQDTGINHTKSPPSSVY